MNCCKKTFYKLADVVVAIEGNNRYADALRKYFLTEKIDIDHISEQFLIQVNLSQEENDFVPDYYSLSGKISFNENEYKVRKKYYEYRIKYLFDKNETTVLSINWFKKPSTFNYIKNHMRLFHIGVYKNEDDFVNAIMNYEVFFYIFSLVLMKYNKIFVHSAIVACENKAVVLAGTGGCGKTSTLLQFLENSQYEYIAEDFGILSKNGDVLYLPKKIAIYQSDARYKNQKVLNALKKLSFYERFSWNLFKWMGLNPRYRFAPHQLFEQTVRKSKIGSVIYLARKNSTQIFKRYIDEQQFIEKTADASFRELRELYEILNNIRAVGNEKIRNVYPTLDKIKSDYMKILEVILNTSTYYMLEVPLKGYPSDIVKAIQEMDYDKKQSTAR